MRWASHHRRLWVRGLRPGCKADFEERKSKLKRALVTALGPAAPSYLIVGEGRRPMRFRVALSADAFGFAKT